MSVNKMEWRTGRMGRRRDCVYSPAARIQALAAQEMEIEEDQSEEALMVRLGQSISQK
jgi:hypothetical protein